MIRRPLVLIVGLLLGCGGGDASVEGARDDDPVLQVTGSDEGLESTVPAPYLEAVRTAMASGPEAVMELYLAWDTAGYRLSREDRGPGRALYLMSCFLPEEDCDSPEPGWDMAVVVRGYSWEPTIVSTDSAVFAVTYDQVGRLPHYAAPDFRPYPPDTVRVARREDGWYLTSFIRPHVSLARALDISLTDADTALVQEWRRGTPPAPGRLVIIGGALQADNAAVYEPIIEGRNGGGPICVVPTAGSDPQASMDGAVARLESYGGAGSAKGVLITTDDPSRARDPAVAAELATCSGFYFTGGSQSRIADVFLPGGDTTEAYRFLWRRWREGAVVAGSSAGAAMMSRVMISGGGSDEAVALGVAPDPDSDGVEIRGGMGFFDVGIVDQHFLARGRIGRLLVAVLPDASPRLGLGIDENTALIVDGDSAVVVGASGVVVVDSRSAERTAPHRATGLRLSVAGAGDVIDLRTFEVRPSPTKRPVPVTEAPVTPPEDPFARWAFLHLVVDLAASADQEATVAVPGASLRIIEDSGFSASMTGSTGGTEGAPAGFSAGPFRVDLLDTGR